jgi:hypothetical protein
MSKSLFRIFSSCGITDRIFLLRDSKLATVLGFSIKEVLSAIRPAFVVTLGDVCCETGGGILIAADLSQHMHQRVFGEL